MESPPSFSTHSEVPPLSEDSGFLITSGSFSSDSASGWHHITSELQESDFDERSLSLCESTETSERMGGEFFNTVKKGPAKAVIATIEPPPQFQDIPVTLSQERFTAVVVPPTVYTNDSLRTSLSSSLDVIMSRRHLSPVYPRKLKVDPVYERRQINHRFASPRLLHVSPGKANRPSSRNSLSSRLSSSHNSLVMVTQFQADDSNFITQAISHDTLSKTCEISDMYNVPIGSDIYAVPIDTLPPHNTRTKEKKPTRNNKKRGKSTPLNIGANYFPPERNKSKDPNRYKDARSKRHSLPSSSYKKTLTESDSESLTLTLQLHEMSKYLHTLYSSSSDTECKNTMNNQPNNTQNDPPPPFAPKPTLRRVPSRGTAVFLTESIEVSKSAETNNNVKKGMRNPFCFNSKNKRHKDNGSNDIIDKTSGQKIKISPVRILSMNLKASFCNLFRLRRSESSEGGAGTERVQAASPPAAVRRALPPLPPSPRTALASNPRRAAHAAHTAHAAHAAAIGYDDDITTDFATSIQKVKDYGWYWGPLSVEAAEKILSNEPDGSFIVRDSSDDHYIFTLTFKLNGLRHVRIEHDQGNFCFGGCTMFKAATIVEFIENAVETSRSGRYLFFLNLRPVLGPVRVQLLYPVSRFKRVQSLQHMCRFVILKHVRRDLVSKLPLPRRLLDYLSATHYYSELLSDI